MRLQAALFGFAAALSVACGDTELGGPAENDRTGGSSGASGGSTCCGGGGRQSAGGRATGGEGAGGSGAGGHSHGGALTGGTSSGGQAAGGQASGGASSGGALTGGASSGGQASGGTGGTTEIPSRCDAFEDRSGSGATRTIEWGFGIGFIPERCMRVKKGQSVRFEGNFGAHPIGPGGGDSPNPFSGLPDPVAGVANVSFPATGVFGFECGIHATMSGAILVVD